MAANLPSLSPDAEDAFVADLAEADDEERLIGAIDAAIAAKRPLLAARLVCLLPEDPDGQESPAIGRARHAARMMLLRREEAPDRYFSALEEAWNDDHHARVKRLKQNMRDRLNGFEGRRGRVSGTTRRRS